MMNGEYLMARNQDASTRWDAGIPDTTDLYINARRARDAYVAEQIARGFKAVYRTLLQPMAASGMEVAGTDEQRACTAALPALCGFQQAAPARRPAVQMWMPPDVDAWWSHRTS